MIDPPPVGGPRSKRAFDLPERAEGDRRRAAGILSALRRRYPDAHCELDATTPHELLVATILSAQCTDERVNQITPLLFLRASTPEEMLDLSVPQIRSIIRPCGLSPAKSKAIRGLSKILVEEHAGCVPADFEALEELHCGVVATRRIAEGEEILASYGANYWESRL